MSILAVFHLFIGGTIASEEYLKFTGVRQTIIQADMLRVKQDENNSFVGKNKRPVDTAEWLGALVDPWKYNTVDHFQIHGVNQDKQK